MSDGIIVFIVFLGIASIAGTVLWFYLTDMKRTSEKHREKP